MARLEKKLTKDQKSEIETLSKVLTVDQIANFFGICKNTFLKMREKDPEIDELYKKGKACSVGKVGSKLLESALDGNLTAIIFYLKTQAGWRETTNVNNINTNLDLTKEEMEKLSTGELKSLQGIFEKLGEK